MTVETDEELEALRRIGSIVGGTLRDLSTQIRAGITTGELDFIGERMLRAAGARSAPPMVYGFPGAFCISVNDEAAHGVPGDRVLIEGDLVKIDLTAELNGYMADAAVTVSIPPVAPSAQILVQGASASLRVAIGAATAGRRLRDVGRAVEHDVRRRKLMVIRELCGHGVGRTIHEEPRCVPSYDDPHAGMRLTAGAVIALEPHISTGTGRIATAPDGWTLRTRDGSPVANFEHTVVITNRRAIVLTAA